MAILSIVNNIIRAPVLKQWIFKKILHGSTVVGILSQDGVLLNFLYKPGVLSSSTSARLYKDNSKLNVLTFLKSRPLNKKGNYLISYYKISNWLKTKGHGTYEFGKLLFAIIDIKALKCN